MNTLFTRVKRFIISVIKILPVNFVLQVKYQNRLQSFSFSGIKLGCFIKVFFFGKYNLKETRHSEFSTEKYLIKAIRFNRGLTNIGLKAFTLIFNAANLAILRPFLHCVCVCTLLQVLR